MGRFGGKDTVDDYKYISIYDFYKRGTIKEGNRSGNLNFSKGGRQTGFISYVLNIGDESYLQLKFIATGDDGIEKKFDYKIKLDRTSSNYGGYKYWFLCPCTGD